MSYVLVNDEILPRDQASVDLEDRGYQFGDGIYEAVAAYRGKLLKMDEHLVRLQRSARELQINLPYSAGQIKDNLLKLHSFYKDKSGLLYLQVTRGTAPRKHYFPVPSAIPRLTAYFIPSERPMQLHAEGVPCILAEDIRWLRCDIKSLNLLGNVLAKQQAAANHAYEAILHRGDTITEGSSTNVFMVKDGIVYTHPSNNFILNGITRMSVLGYCRSLNYEVREQAFSVHTIVQADEVFLTGSSIDVVPVVQIAGRPVGAGLPGPITRALQQQFEQSLSELGNS